MKQFLLNTYYKLLGFLARKYIAKTKPYIIGINGSVGKTSCRMIVSQTLQQLLPNVSVYTSPKNFNGELGMSLSIFEIESYTPTIIGMMKVFLIAMKSLLRTKNHALSNKVLVLEYGIDHPGEMEFLVSICKPHISIHTQIDSVHSMQFGDPHAIAKEEFILQQNTKNIVFLNQDDPYISHVVGTTPCDVISYSATGDTEGTIVSLDTTAHAEFEIINATFQSAKVTFNNKKSIFLGINILGHYHLSYASVGVCIAEIISYAFFKKPAFEEDAHISLALSLQPGRRSIFDGIYNSIIVDSTYNASPRSVKQIIEEVHAWRNHKYPTYKLLFVLGDMRELGSQEEKEHTKLALFLQSYDANLFMVGKVMEQIVEPFFERNGPGRLQQILNFITYKECAEYLQTYLSEHQHEKFIIVCKGSQNTIFLEEVVASILSNSNDKKKLTRQGSRREGKKQAFLASKRQ